MGFFVNTRIFVRIKKAVDMHVKVLKINALNIKTFTTNKEYDKKLAERTISSAPLDFKLFVILFAFVGFACATQNVSEFMTNEFLDVRSCGFQVFTRVELVGMFVEELTNRSRHSKS